MTTQLTDIDLIDVGPRLRPLNETKVAAFMVDIDERGVRKPIEIAPREGGRFLLVSGRHRLDACRRLGHRQIETKVKKRTAAECLRDELMENLVSAELTTLERAQYLAAQRRLYQEEHPETRQGRAGGLARQGSATANLAFADWSAKRVGMTPRSVARYAALGDLLDEQAADQLRGTEFENKLGELDALSRHAPDKQRRIVALLTAEENPATSVAMALAMMEGRAASENPHEAIVRRLSDTWDRGARRARIAFLDQLVERGVIDGYHRERC